VPAIGSAQDGVGIGVAADLAGGRMDKLDLRSAVGAEVAVVAALHQSAAMDADRRKEEITQCLEPSLHRFRPYCTRRSARPWGGAVKMTAVRRRPSRSARTWTGVNFPSPTATKAPTRLRTIL